MERINFEMDNFQLLQEVRKCIVFVFSYGLNGKCIKNYEKILMKIKDTVLLIWERFLIG